MESILDLATGNRLPLPICQSSLSCKRYELYPTCATTPHILAPSHPEPVAECLRLNACFHRHTRTHTHTHTPDGNESMSDLFQQRHVVIRPLSPAFHISNWQRRQMKPNETKRHQRHQRHKMTPATPSTPNDTPALMTHILHGINSGSCHGESFALAHLSELHLRAKR